MTGSNDPGQLIEQEHTEGREIERFESGLVLPESFHHADHVRLGFCYLHRYSPLEAIGRFCRALKQFAHSQGKENLYHETITWAYLLVMNERMHRTRGQSWEEFAAANADLLTWNDGILSRYYTEATLKSARARQVFVFPDNSPTRDACGGTRSTCNS